MCILIISLKNDWIRESYITIESYISQKYLHFEFKNRKIEIYTYCILFMQQNNCEKQPQKEHLLNWYSYYNTIE